MKRIIYIHLQILIVVLLVLVVEAQEPNFTPTPLPTLSRNTPFWAVFPANMYCYDISTPFSGPRWGEIAIGTSTVEDLKAYVASIGKYDSINQWADYISFAMTGNLRDETGIPSVVGGCVDVSTQTIQALSISTINPTLYLDDLVARYGIPDAVTWGSSNISRTVFWFAEGIAASVNILEQNPMLEYGQISMVVYFPYQMKEDYEDRWPYNRTNSENPIGGDRLYEPPPSEAQNPFDFETMIATITAEPTRIPTPTFAPVSLTPTATP